MLNLKFDQLGRLPPERRAMEQMHAQMDLFLEDKESKTTEDMNTAIQREFVGQPIEPGRFPPRNPVEQAQELCYQAFDSCGRRIAVGVRQQKSNWEIPDDERYAL